ncbi:fumarylacetoacetate hydrolase [Agrobacterium vitis]|uniref:Fumarylacetoacetate hydrolase family protein n=1 Tax=Agrobacterium vitis TaxID=373 RepID=A0AAE2RCI4_AGRVI|nr:fumarylacetoacetate hydrolase family protein [Agrobacterium vitis]MBF2714146.1 fumarylacetoacetate hydrolase family protein [Agrobacterium vitis]MUO81525.1 fumarylacetoacetate hydrolase [Agrobacterium vitis]MUO95828.1 fumarylacetoacetate hydrolase [Agrobacterium vitis]MVA93907.1 fumarylacetoacetate hydrolase [Agrobacterium vitis]MVB03586.1 fumarylacetoacetate hydrolase [Agrobacterium vitis]
MKLATIPNGTRDGELVVVSADLSRAVSAREIAPNLLTAFEDWSSAEPKLRALAKDLAEDLAKNTFAFDQATALSPLPRSFQWIDGSCFKNHLYLMAKATGRDPEIEMNSPFPLMYQGMSDDFYRPHGDIPLPREEDNIDFEAEVGIVLDEVPMGTTAAEAPQYVRLILLINDVSCRVYVKREITVGFGWMNAKPSTAFSPVAVTPDELGAAWTGKVELPIRVDWNGIRFGEPNGREMSYTFYELIEHAARTRKLAAGTIFGSGTISNADYRNVGSACIAERRSIEMLEHGEHRTGFMKFGDTVRIEMFDKDGISIFGAIEQTVTKYEKVA